MSGILTGLVLLVILGLYVTARGVVQRGSRWVYLILPLWTATGFYLTFLCVYLIARGLHG